MKKLPTHLLVNGQELALSAVPKGEGRYEVRVGEQRFEVSAIDLGREGFAFTTEDGVFHRAQAAALGEDLQVRVDGRSYRLASAEQVGAASSADVDPSRILAPMTGTLVNVLVAPGDEVEEEQDLAILSAMKMEHKLRAPRAGTVAEVCAKAGETVDAQSLIVRLEDD
jgi:3-methylcrotonyl-CoA carboxylase alpha subunit